MTSGGKEERGKDGNRHNGRRRCRMTSGGKEEADAGGKEEADAGFNPAERRKK